MINILLGGNRMARIGCNVINCSHNDSGICYANKISVNGKKARTSNHTC